MMVCGNWTSYGTRLKLAMSSVITSRAVSGIHTVAVYGRKPLVELLHDVQLAQGLSFSARITLAKYVPLAGTVANSHAAEDPSSVASRNFSAVGTPSGSSGWSWFGCAQPRSWLRPRHRVLRSLLDTVLSRCTHPLVQLIASPAMHATRGKPDGSEELPRVDHAIGRHTAHLRLASTWRPTSSRFSNWGSRPFERMR